MHYGLIPELIGRLHVVATLEDLKEKELVQILTQPKNALIKQYSTMLKMDKVKLTITDDALKAIAKKAIERKVGARGLRSIMEDIMLNIMYDVPSLKNISECIVNEDCVLKKDKPILVTKTKEKTA